MKDMDKGLLRRMGVKGQNNIARTLGEVIDSIEMSSPRFKEAIGQNNHALHTLLEEGWRFWSNFEVGLEGPVEEYFSQCGVEFKIFPVAYDSQHRVIKGLFALYLRGDAQLMEDGFSKWYKKRKKQ